MKRFSRADWGANAGIVAAVAALGRARCPAICL